MPDNVMLDGAVAGVETRVVRRRSRLEKIYGNAAFWRGLVALAVFAAVWEVGARSDAWFGVQVPFLGKLPALSEVVMSALQVFDKPGYWASWYQSIRRVLTGFIIAQIIGIPFGLALSVNRYFRDIFFTPFEILRPIPPLAWVPASLIFWPTNELSIAFVTFLGAFFTIVINVLGGARSIDVRYLRAAQSMGASQWHLFSRIIFPGTLPLDLHGRRRRHGNHLERRPGRGDDLRRRNGRQRRPRVLHLELVYGRLAGADHRRNDIDRHRGVPLKRRHPRARRLRHAVAQDVLSGTVAALIVLKQRNANR